MTPGVKSVVSTFPIYAGSNRIGLGEAIGTAASYSKGADPLLELLKPDPFAERQRALREANEAAVQAALEEKAARRTEARQREILEQTAKSVESAQAGQFAILSSSQQNLKSIMGKVVLIGVIAFVAVAGLKIFQGKKDKKAKGKTDEDETPSWLKGTR